MISDSFISSKKDKRTIKHSSFVSRIEKANRKPLKRRRPNKQLKTTLEGLADSLPNIEELVAEGNGKLERGKIRQKTLKSRPGAMKRREKLEREERERFGKNMAQMIGVVQNTSTVIAGNRGEAAQPSTTASRWAALRGFISQTMEQKEEFRK